MRKTNIDEFPQFINVLKGDMSIVGPRPHMLHHTEVYGSLIDKYMVRHFSKPGITGWAQVTGYRGETKELWQMEERIRRDIWYIENWSFWLDIKIIFMTAKSLICPDKNVISLDNSWCITVGYRMHNRCCACAYQLLCKRTTAVVRPEILTVSTTYPISSKNIS